MTATTLLPLICLLGCSPPAAQDSAATAPFAIRAGRVLLGDGTALEHGVIVVEGGKIAAVGAEPGVPEGAIWIDHPGTASAGLVALHAYSGAAGELFDSTRTVLPEASAAVPFDPSNSELEDALRVGITTLLLTPAPRALCAGTGALVKTAGGATLRARAVLSLGFRADSLRDDLGPTSFGGALAELDRRLESPSGAFAQAAAGDLPVLFEVATRQDVARAVEFARRHELAGALHGAGRAGELAASIRDAGLSVVCGPFQPGQDRRDLLSVVELAKAGVPFGFGVDAPGNDPALLRASAAMCVREGLAADAAWRALTSDAARIAGVSDRIGEIAEGRDADIVLWSGDPLDLGSSIEAIYVDGERVWEDRP